MSTPSTGNRHHVCNDGVFRGVRSCQVQVLYTTEHLLKHYLLFVAFDNDANTQT